ncbi:MAG TPA: recombination mediator RecR [Candidatus Woesebacteria bacterium]|nr:recombination mediator RecR [Candidatus Woesebacteria bacterium]
MAKLPRAVVRLIEQFERLPGIGPKSAQRLVFYLLHNPEEQINEFASRLHAIKTEITLCSICHEVTETDPCALCSDPNRDKSVLCVLEQPLDLIAIENSNRYQGMYHVLHGAIDPLNNIGPEQLFISDILNRLDGVRELILATNPTMEGEATALYIKEMIEKASRFSDLTITRIGHGLPIGADIEYADGVTLARALDGRRKIE